MSAARIFTALILLLAIAAMVIMIGCDPKRSGTATPNQIPKMFIVNTPPNDAQFSRNPELNWYATDIDGYISYFRYAVVLEDEMVINGNPVTPDEFIAQATDAQFGWTKLNVSLDQTRSTATIRLYADTLDPINSFVDQYFFVQASDDQGAMSEIVWRKYSRNNHYPNTRFRSKGIYINAVDANAPGGGISLSWEGYDSADYGRAVPPLEYEWRLYGPFDSNDSIYAKIVLEDCVYDPTADSFVNCKPVPVLNLDAIPSTLMGVQQPLAHSKGPNFSTDPTDVWVSATQATIYNVYQKIPLSKTSQFKFVFWVRSRDDGYVPDPTPSYSQFLVAEAKYERNVAILDETGFSIQGGRWGVEAMDTTKAYFYNYLHNAGITTFDTVGGLDYFNLSTRRNYTGGTGLAFEPELLDILSHKVLIFIRDDVNKGPDETDFGIFNRVFFGLDMGCNAWGFSLNTGNAGNRGERNQAFSKSLNFQRYFGVAGGNSESWFAQLVRPPRKPTEEFIGAYSNISGFPSIMVDYGKWNSLMQTRYYYDTANYFNDTTLWTYGPGPDTGYLFRGLPDVGVIQRTALAAPLYLYLSRDGDRSVFHGKVCAVMLEDGDMRTAWYCFTPTAMDSVAMQQTFNLTMPWLLEKFQPAPSPKPMVQGDHTMFATMAERQYRVQQYLNYIDTYATEEEKELLGVTMTPITIDYNIPPERVE